jgi:uncharacterized protein
MALTDPRAGHSITLAEVTLVEAAAAFAAQERARPGVSPLVRQRTLAQFLRDCGEQFLIRELSRTVVNTAIPLTARHRLRGYDAVQLATALVANTTVLAVGGDALVFVSADASLLTAAQSEGLEVDNPLSHP